jgi:hypothetical protein
VSISTIYHVNVTIHDDVYQAFGHTNEYEVKFLAATKGSLSAGQNPYSDVEVWADFHILEEARQCEKRIVDMVCYFAAKLGDEAEVQKTDKVHAATIKLWVDGAVIEYQCRSTGQWKPCSHNAPRWNPLIKYRVKS